jgi:hypothetical protein
MAWLMIALVLLLLALSVLRIAQEYQRGVVHLRERIKRATSQALGAQHRRSASPR